MTVPDRLSAVEEALLDTESLTMLVAADRSREDVAALLDIDLGHRLAEEDWFEDEDRTAWALLAVPGGVLGIERSGYGDPSLDALQALSAGGRAAAVVRSNIQAHYRFGCARDGVLVFDDDEYWLQAEAEEVPADLRPLFDLVSVADDGPLPENHPSPFLIGLAMAEVATGLTLDPARITELVETDYFSAPILVYP